MRYKNEFLARGCYWKGWVRQRELYIAMGDFGIDLDQYHGEWPWRPA